MRMMTAPVMIGSQLPVERSTSGRRVSNAAPTRGPTTGNPTPPRIANTWTVIVFIGPYVSGRMLL